MRDQLFQYVNLLFAGTIGMEDVKQEILQNTLDRYDDLITQGKSPESAYRLAISGIGDLSEILAGEIPDSPRAATPRTSREDTAIFTRLMRAIAIGLYILSPIPLIVLDTIGMDIFGLSGTLAIIAVATVILLLFKKNQPLEAPRQEAAYSAQAELRKSIRKLISAVGLILYLALSFVTGAWYITWVIFPIIAAANGLVGAILDLLEANRYED